MYVLHTISNLATARTRGTSSHSPLSRDFSSLKCSRTIILIVIVLKSLPSTETHIWTFYAGSRD